MIKSAIEQVITEDLADIWSILNGDEKRRVIDNFVIHKFKKNQIIYAEKDEPEFLWTLLTGSVKKYKDGVGGRVQILRLIAPCSISGIAPTLPESLMFPARQHLSRRRSGRYRWRLLPI